jgi:hypothetical protein
MLMIWTVRYVDSQDRQFKDRHLWLDTAELDPATRAAVELCHDLDDQDGHRGMLQYRQLFREEKNLPRRLQTSAFCVPEYFEDENGNAVDWQTIGRILSGCERVTVLPPGAKRHDVDLARTGIDPIDLAEIDLSEEELQVLAYFTRDLREMQRSAFMSERPGTLTHAMSGSATLETSVSDEEIRSYVMIFRRLYMEKEQANFEKAVDIVVGALGDHPLAPWLAASAAHCLEELEMKPDFVLGVEGPAFDNLNVPFTRKRLIDVFLYTRYAHQPDARRARQFRDCLAVVQNRHAVLMWLFLNAIWFCGKRFEHIGVHVADFYDRYTASHQISLDILDSVVSDNPGIGILETRSDRAARILNEKAEELARSLWEEQGEPEGGHQQFLLTAKEQLHRSLE